MSRIKTLIAGALIMTGLTDPVRADDDLVRVFAGCTGRISAEMEFSWLIGDGRADALQAQRQRFVSILEAVMPTERARETLNYRVEAKLAHSAMLTTAHFGTDARLSRLVRQQARQSVQTCRTLLLEG